jgi:hypothetical protein
MKKHKSKPKNIDFLMSSKNLSQYLYYKANEIAYFLLGRCHTAGIGPSEKLVREFRINIKKTASNSETSSKTWNENSQKVCALVLTKNPEGFLRWPLIQYTMFVNNSPIIIKEFNYLRHHKDWQHVWKKAISEAKVGHPTPFILFPKSSPNLIHNAYHVARFQDKLKVRIKDVNLVVEFGGGYGGLCRLFYNLGFNGTYVIFDLPVFSDLQVFYLKMLGLNASLDLNVQGISCVSKISEVEQIINNVEEKKFFVATWSISETPFSLRNTFLPLVQNFDLFLIGYQNQFQEFDNIDFFTKWSESLKEIEWHNDETKTFQGNYYLFGQKKS